MVEQITPKRKPLFGKKEVVKVQPKKFVPKTTTTKPVEVKKPSMNKLWISVGVIVVAIVAIVIILLVSGVYVDEVVEKSSILIPFLWKWKR
ncbi:hypothetical protein HOC80_00735 [archaeon]|jgi:cytochrome c biogenesis factor|nr:hypothetical protein [archaeon]MBT4416611.1 hypothetical protein [archaeon]